MLKISLTYIYEQDKEYIVFLDRGLAKKFANKRKAEDFLRLVSKNLNEAYLFLSDEYLVAEGIFRDMYLYIRSSQNRLTLKNSLDFLRNRLDAIPTHSNMENKNYFTIRNIENSLLELLSVYRVMMDGSISRSNTALIHKLNMRCRIVELVAIDYRNFQQKIEVESNINVHYNDMLKIV